MSIPTAKVPVLAASCSPRWTRPARRAPRSARPTRAPCRSTYGPVSCRGGPCSTSRGGPRPLAAAFVVERGSPDEVAAIDAMVFAGRGAPDHAYYANRPGALSFVVRDGSRAVAAGHTQNGVIDMLSIVDTADAVERGDVGHLVPGRQWTRSDHDRAARVPTRRCACCSTRDYRSTRTTCTAPPLPVLSIPCAAFPTLASAER